LAHEGNTYLGFVVCEVDEQDNEIARMPIVGRWWSRLFTSCALETHSGQACVDRAERILPMNGRVEKFSRAVERNRVVSCGVQLPLQGAQNRRVVVNDI
jgi:hypothetical protein